MQRGLHIPKLTLVGGKSSGGEQDDLIYSGQSFTLRAMRRSSGRMLAMEWYVELELRYQARVQAAAMNLDRSLASGRPAGRLDFVKNSTPRLSEFRITKAGGSPPHLRMLGLMKRGIFWAAIGIKKKSDELRRTDIEAAQRVTMEWLDAGGGMK